ncbi:MAG: gluconate 2-dehydrogenase subunit 3 family protein [Bacteroidota bacterium]
MDRRAALKTFVVVSAGAMVLPSCLQTDSNQPASIVPKNIHVNAEQEKLLAELSEFILPTTSTPGAKQLASHQYILMMVDDCYKKEEQDIFINGLRQFNDFAKKQSGESFANADAAKRTELLKTLESKKDIPEEVLSFYSTAKRLAIQSFTGSKYYLTEVRKYEMVPGRFHGCFPVSNIKS